jgi:hypothetical protein
LHQSDLADLAFLRNASIDLVVSVFALAAVDDLDRVFRKYTVCCGRARVHRESAAPVVDTHRARTRRQPAHATTIRDQSPMGEGATLTIHTNSATLHASLARGQLPAHDVVLEPDVDIGDRGDRRSPDGCRRR